MRARQPGATATKLISELSRLRTSNLAIVGGGQAKDFLLGAYETASKILKNSPCCLGYELAQCTEARESYMLLCGIPRTCT
jgi:hypothetical protein